MGKANTKWLVFFFFLLTTISCYQTKPTKVIGKLLAAFGKCGLKVGFIDANKLHHLLQVKHGFDKLDPKEIIMTLIELLPVSKGYKILKITLKSGIQIGIRYVQLQAGIATIGTMYIIDALAEIVDRSCS